MNATLPIITLAAVGLNLTACGLQNDDFMNALPSEQAVTIQAPQENANALTAVGERSEYYNTTRQMTRDVNGGVKGIVGLLKQIAATPATSRDGDSRTWGPGADALDPVIYRMVATKDGEGLFSYKLQYRERGSEDEEANYVSLVEGNADVTAGTNDGLGSMTLYIDNWAAVEPGACGTGTLTVDYDTTSEPAFLAVEFDNFSDTCPDADGSRHEALAAATYYYSRNADGSGNFQFTASGDIDNDTVLAGTNETFAIRSRWNADGTGRSDVRIYGGDMETNHGLTEVTANECWDEVFNLTYANMTPPAVDPSHANIGEEADCPAAFASGEYATDLPDAI